jgi:EpsI family protein
MGNILVRMGVVIGALLVVQVGLAYVFHLRNPEVVPLPPHALETFPMLVKTESTGDWSGKDQKLDNEQFNYAQLDDDVSRLYTNRDNRTLSVLLGVYSSTAIGLYHNPFNCYNTHGFTLKDNIRKRLDTARPNSEISLSTWEREGQKYVVGFWYEVGDHTMFERDDLPGAQWAMRGRSKWPVTFKVLIQAPAAGDIDQARADVLEMAAAVREWLGKIQPPAD